MIKSKGHVIEELLADIEARRARYKQLWGDDEPYDLNDDYTGDVVVRKKFMRELEQWRGLRATVLRKERLKETIEPDLQKGYEQTTRYLYSKILDWNSFGYFETTPSAQLERTIVLMQQRISNLEAEKATVKEELKTALRELKEYRDKESAAPQPEQPQPPKQDYRGVA